MSRKQLLLTMFIAAGTALLSVAGSLFLFSQALTAPSAAAKEAAQTDQGLVTYHSVSGLAFMPVQQDTAYAKDIQNQLLQLTSQVRNFSGQPNRFVAPLALPDAAELRGMTVFGQDADNLGEVRLRLKRCNHGQPFCVILGETSSTTGYAAGQFETARVNIINEIVDHRLYSYFLELELTALGESGLRSVRLEMITSQNNAPREEERWALSGDVRAFTLPNLDLSQARICANNLNQLDNPTHYPFVVVDERTIPLSSDSCVTVWGRDIEVRRRANTGPSSGTYQFLR